MNSIDFLQNRPDVTIWSAFIPRPRLTRPGYRVSTAAARYRVRWAPFRRPDRNRNTVVTQATNCFDGMVRCGVEPQS